MQAGGTGKKTDYAGNAKGHLTSRFRPWRDNTKDSLALNDIPDGVFDGANGCCPGDRFDLLAVIMARHVFT